MKGSGNRGWWIIETVESNNGKRISDQGNFIEWFSADAFGGTNYSNIPAGAVSHVAEPGPYWNDPYIYFGLWRAEKNFAICAWNSRRTPYLQAIGDPLIVKQPMKMMRNVILLLLVLVSKQNGEAQGFLNLNFESATLVPVPGDPYGSVYFSQAFPGWTQTIVGAISTNALYNGVFLDSAGISIIDPAVSEFVTSKP